MEPVPNFSLHRPATLEEANNLMRRNPEARLVAGGTDLIVNIRRGIVDTDCLIDLNDVAEMNGLGFDKKSGALHIGAAVTLAELANDDTVIKSFPAVAAAAGAVAGPTHRQMGTVGGNLCLDTRCIYYNQSEWWRSSNDYCLKYRGDVCHVAPKSSRCFAAFSGDLAPALLVYGATAQLAGPGGEREIPLTELYQDDGADHLTLEECEVLVSITVPAAEGVVSDYVKMRVRGSIDFPLAGTAIALKRDGDKISRFTIAFTGTNSYPVLIEGVDVLIGKPLDDKALDALAAYLPKQIRPMKSTFTGQSYRRRVAINLAKRLAQRLFEAAA